MRKIIILAFSCVITAGCSSLRYSPPQKVAEADQYFLCDASYNGEEFSTKHDSRLELEMRGKSWESSECQYIARGEQTRREQVGDLPPMIVHDPAWEERAKQWKSRLNTSTQDDDLDVSEMVDKTDSFIKNILN